MLNGSVLPKVHSINKGVNPNLRPEKQVLVTECTSTITCSYWTKKSDSCKIKSRSRQSRHKENNTAKVPYTSSVWITRIAKIISRKKTYYSSIRKNNSAKPKIVTLPKILPKTPEIQEPISAQKSVKPVDHLYPVIRSIVKPIVAEIVPS